MRLKISSTITALIIGAALLGAMPSRAAADSRANCQRRVERAQEHYRREAHEHGKHSRQAENARAKLTSAWDRCWNEAHAWYDPNRHEWRTDRDWDRHYDWDHDRDDH